MKRKRSSICSKCSENLEETRIGQGYCKNCHAAYMRENRPLHKDLPHESRMKANARSYVNVYIRRGLITKKPCVICGDKAQMHHEDYSKPLEVIWYCRKHHLEYHKTGTVK